MASDVVSVACVTVLRSFSLTRRPIYASPAPGLRSTPNDRLKAATPLLDEHCAGQSPARFLHAAIRRAVTARYPSTTSSVSLPTWYVSFNQNSINVRSNGHPRRNGHVPTWYSSKTHGSIRLSWSHWQR